MINLIPPEGHIALKREYYIRVASTFSLLFGSAFLLLTVAYAPTYILVNAQIKALELEVNDNLAIDDTVKDVEAEVRLTQSVLSKLKAQMPDVLGSEVIEEIERTVKGGITFKNFSIEQTNGRIERIQVQGTAPTREALAQFKNAIGASPMFLSGEVPIADLARELNLPFAITITLDHS